MALERYIAASALRINEATSVPSCGYRLVPMLALVKNSCSPAWNGALKQASSLLAI
ncbi:hypothetical protein D3C79_890330 [compost metagenome]